jgi:hypothetical protein
MLFAAVNGGAYKFVLVLHILAAVVGFGSVMLNGVYAAQVKRRRGVEGAAIADANYTVSFGWAMWFVYAVVVLGLALVGMSDKAWKFSQTWVWLAFVIYVALIGVVHGLHRPNERRLLALMREGTGPDRAEMERRERLAGIVGPILSLMVVAVLFLMVFKPGAPGS